MTKCISYADYKKLWFFSLNFHGMPIRLGGFLCLEIKGTALIVHFHFLQFFSSLLHTVLSNRNNFLTGLIYVDETNKRVDLG